MKRRRISVCRVLFLVGLTGCDPCPGHTPIPASICVAASSAMVSTGDFEPNDDLMMATPPPLGSAACASTVQAIVTGSEDVDVFRTGFCSQTSNDPFATQDKNDPNLRTCLFLSCNFGTTNVYGCYQDQQGDSETQAQRDKTTVQKGTTDSGFTGCCRMGKGRVSVQIECSGVRKKAIEGYLWFDSADAGGDHPFSASYSVQ